MHPTADTSVVIGTNGVGRRVMPGVRRFYSAGSLRLNMLKRLWSWALLCLIVSVPVSLADHLSPELQARGTPETRLAGVQLGRGRVAGVIRKYGKPTKVIHHPPPPGLKAVDAYEYFWTRPGMKLRLLADDRSGIKGGEYISLVEVEGSRAFGAYGRTGKGLKLGDSLADLRRIYGRKYLESKKPELKFHDVMIQWRREEFSLIAEFDDKGRIKKLFLYAPE
jgi:hypothetical protein